MLTSTDIAFASSAVITRDVAGAAFQYAKIQTLPFFGSGIVELPPEGFKRTKNSRKMHMAFFVHEGKVLVTVGPPATDSDKQQQPETNEFAISKGGVWIVPRGMFFVFLFPLPPFPTPPLGLRAHTKWQSPRANARGERSIGHLQHIAWS